MGAFVILIASIFAGTYLFAPKATNNTSPQPHESAAEDQMMTVTISIENKLTNTSVSISAHATALDILTKLSESHQDLALESVAYDGLGTLVTSMYGLKNGENNNYWQYTVNGITPQIGASALVPAEGDSIVWSFKAFDESVL